jgi:hypothetical protein
MIEPRLRVHLLAGEHISTLDGLKLFNTLRIAVFVRLLRKKGLNIITEMKTDPKTGKRYGVYYIPKTTKKSRI